ncbi:DNA polymerase-1 [Labedella gwakjiensis]|uniref:DNA-directed DNA polymerase n=1 Tax=Labedella gwakjiensis TaxID=390269 RepID=A0A2P8GVR0_9MICO|nr:bifunctional 3'-5' exonuclease/DNA polymerase [Labedella gwakjiensis]PSL38043.1 DNA polymerase-1 [Labedella gwakjiensis]RUQ87396.1 bifunctional 3'-5' exonuclease/DNA polymerase [Labedella gwakjiensis]
MHLVAQRLPDGRVSVARIHDDGGAQARAETLSREDWPLFVARTERDEPGIRWVWDDTAAWYPPLLAAGVRVARCVDLRLCHAILRSSTDTSESSLATAPAGPWDAPIIQPREADAGALFDLVADEPAGGERDPLAEFEAQRAAVASATADARSRLSLLIAAESAGALIASEMTFAGLPWDARRHDDLLVEMLGPRPAPGVRPRVLQEVLDEVTAALDVGAFSPESPGELLRALQSAGIPATSTRSWELKQFEHPAIAPLLRYKKLARLHTANGWNWLDQWIHDGRFRPTYVPGGVVTGRWASDGGGALQLPHQIRSAVVADPGWRFVVADAAQLEPRILSAISGDAAMATAARGVDLYDGMVRTGAIDTRAHAKVAMLGAMYGATTGESGRLLPRLTRAYPQAIGFVEAAARAGERGERVSTRLGRSSPLPGRAWRELQQQASGDASSEAIGRRARTEARNWGRFTRNFVVQGTAAEWALCWMASLRTRLAHLAGGAPLTRSAHLVFFLHDEIVVHCPESQAERVAELVRESAAEAGRLIFGRAPVDFPVTTAVVASYDQAK